MEAIEILRGRKERYQEKRTEAFALRQRAREANEEAKAIRDYIWEAETDAVREALAQAGVEQWEISRFVSSFDLRYVSSWKVTELEQKWADLSFEYHKALRKLVNAKAELLKRYAATPEMVNSGGVEVRLNADRFLEGPKNHSYGKGY